MGVYDEITPPSTVNKYDILIIGSVVGCTLIGWCVDNLLLRRRLKGSPSDRPRGWVIGMLVSSYILLIPGLLHTLFGYRIGVMNNLKVMSEKKENMIEFAVELVESGSIAGCFFVVGFAVVLPLVKLVLLIMGGMMRHSNSRKKQAWARRSVLFVQRISKWASPDMFAYILLMYLIRGLNHPPILNGNMDLDVGFSCFSTFCVASTISSMGVRMPSKKDIGVVETDRAPWGFNTLPVLVGTTLLCILFSVMLFFGMTLPCMALRLDMNLLFESGQVDMSLKPIITMLHVQDKAANDVSVSDCIVKLWSWIPPDQESDKPHWEVNSLIAFVMLAGFVFVFTILDMLTLLVTAVLCQVTQRRPSWALEVAHFFRKLSMLDVCCTGVIVIVIAGRIYRESGVVVSFKEGLIYLAIAEVAHYVTYYMVTLTAKSWKPDASNSDSEDSTDVLRDYSRQGTDTDSSDSGESND